MWGHRTQPQPPRSIYFGGRLVDLPFAFPLWVPAGVRAPWTVRHRESPREQFSASVGGVFRIKKTFSWSSGYSVESELTCDVSYVSLLLIFAWRMTRGYSHFEPFRFNEET